MQTSHLKDWRWPLYLSIKKKSNKKINYTALYITFPCYRNLFISTINSNFYHNYLFSSIYIFQFMINVIRATIVHFHF